MVHVRLGGGNADARKGITEQVEKKLNPLTLRHQIEWTTA
jgi:hypothetical protein